MVGGKIVSIGYMGDGIFKLTCVGTGCEARDKISVNVKNPERLPEIGAECHGKYRKSHRKCHAGKAKSPAAGSPPPGFIKGPTMTEVRGPAIENAQR